MNSAEGPRGKRNLADIDKDSWSEKALSVCVKSTSMQNGQSTCIILVHYCKTG
jgi:hypothetical protein